MPDEVSNRLITQSHGLARLPTKLENPGDLCPGSNNHEGSVTHGNKAEIEHITGNVYAHEVNYTNTSFRHRYNICTVLGTWPHTNMVYNL